MAHRTNVPKFGNWDNEENVPYTVFFEKTKKNRGRVSKAKPLSNPQQNPNNVFDPSHVVPAPLQPRPKLEASPVIGREAMRPTGGHKLSWEDVDLRQFSSLTAHRLANESGHGGRGQRPVRAARPSTGFDLSFERVPVNQQHHAKVAARGNVGSSAWDGGSHGGSSHGGSVGKARARLPAPGDESPDGGIAVPKFGEWSENDLQSAAKYSHIFNKVREEKNNEAGNALSITPKRSPYAVTAQPTPPVVPKKCCFPWW